MARVDFLISNAGHHVAMARPVAGELSRRGSLCRLVSLCELRGLASPAQEPGLAVHRLVPHGVRRSPAQGGGLGTGIRGLRRALQSVAWHGYLKRRVRAWLREAPDLVTVPNDAAFPYDRICRELRARGIPFVLLQEGIRFAETVFEDSGIVGQGLSGATAIACWGESSAEFFRQRGAPHETLRITGNPRFDGLDGADRSREIEPTLTLLSNPIELWGFCTAQEKISLVERFTDGLEPVFERTALRLVLKIHRQESLDVFQAIADRSRFADRISVLEDAPLYPLLRRSAAAVILASTVGLEALLLGVPLGVLEVPGVGFIHDFVSSGAARGIAWDRPLGDQIQSLMEADPASDPSVASYLDRTLAARGAATQEVADLIAGLTRRVDLG